MKKFLPTRKVIMATVIFAFLLLVISDVTAKHPFFTSTQRKTENLQNKPPILTYFDTARLSDSSSAVKIFTSDVSNGLGVLFVFTLNDTVIDSLLIQNPNISPPSYKIIKGSTKDYLVVTTIEESGTGYIKEVDSWYSVNQYFHNEKKALLSYTSKLGFYGDEKETEETLANYIPSTLTENSVDIEFTKKKCEKVTNKCKTSTEKKHFIFAK
jgi:hypothetical protein